MRGIAFDIVYGVLENGEHSDEWFHRAVERENGTDHVPSGDVRGRIFTKQEKSFVRRLSYGTVERALELDIVLDHFLKEPVKKMRPAVRTILRMGVYEILYMDSVPESATCNEMVKLAKKKKYQNLSGVVNGVLRNVARADINSLKNELLAHMRTDKQKLSFLYSMPEELVELLLSAYGRKTAEKIAASFYEDNPVTIRVQTMNASASQVKEELMSAGVLVQPCGYIEGVFQIRNFDRVDVLPGFQEGHFTVQDISSMLPVLVSGIKPGDVVADVCSSPGGKAFHAVDCLKGKGIVSARDVSEKKIAKIRENAERLGVGNIRIKIWDAAVPDEEWYEKADVVIADVPCSGIGVIGRKPEIKYEAMKHADSLRKLQREIVTGAEKMLKPGGTLIYSTCTINPAENEKNAEWIVKELPFKAVSIDEFLPEGLRNKMTKAGMLQILPGVHEGDGFFVARFQKVKG